MKMKQLEKLMKKYLKSKNKKLSDFDKAANDLPDEISSYYEARQNWFLRLDEIKKEGERHQNSD
jgi:hypothetical protein